ncbi:MAG TPA: CocE/NonD family hydrolase, partial [Actinomycetota bacterium]|nr:CocE/NonD family hydrolase [Actinomycetota bacterium]
MKPKTLLLLVALAMLPATPAAAAEVYEIHYVPSVGGSVIRVEILRNNNFDAEKQPVLLTYSPYNSLGGRQPASDSIAGRFVRRGYARAVADVLGTRGSTGCWDYGGAAEQQSGVDVVKYLANLPWSNGNVGMIGVSYNGTTANMVAATGIPELKAIVPIAAISRWYGYAYHDGVRYFLNSREVTDQGFDTPLVFDVGFGDTVAPDPTGKHFGDTVVARAGECAAIEHTMHAYSRSPDYTDFWKQRDYRKDAHKFRAAVLLVHGWQDYNVKQVEGVSLFERIPVDDPSTSEVEGVPFKILHMTQESHNDATGPYYAGLLERFLARTLRDQVNGVENEPSVYSLGRDASGAFRTYDIGASWPPAGTGTLALHLGRSFDTIDGVPSSGPIGTVGETGTLTLGQNNDGSGWTHINTGTISEELTLNDPLNEDGHGFYS